MFLQSHLRDEQTGRYRLVLLPALPKAWSDGSVTGLRARGGFAVDITWEKGKLEKVVVHGLAGTRCFVQYGDMEVPVEIGQGGSVSLDSNLTAGFDFNKGMSRRKRYDDCTKYAYGLTCHVQLAIYPIVQGGDFIRGMGECCWGTDEIAPFAFAAPKSVPPSSQFFPLTKGNIMNLPSSKLNRREVLKAAAAGIATVPFVPRSVLAAPGQTGANDRLRIGVIGAGSRVRHLISKATPLDQATLVAVADCNLRAFGVFHRVTKDAFPEVDKCNVYQDYREMLDKENLDGVFVTTPTHGRVLPCIHAFQAGVDVYAEKPVTLTIEEGRVLVDAAKKYKRVFQAGTQARSIPTNRWAVQKLHDGAIGKIKKVLCPNFDSPEEFVPGAGGSIPEGFNWDMWCSQAPLFPYTPGLGGCTNWGKYRPFDGGGSTWGMTGFGAHAFDQIQWGINKDDTSPVEVWTMKPFGPTSRVVMRYADGLVLEMVPVVPAKKEGGRPNRGPGFGGIFIGEKGKLEINRNQARSNPSSIIATRPAFDNPYADRDPKQYDYTTIFQVANWLDCIRTRQQTLAHPEAAHRATVICHLANVARDLNRKLRFDPVSERFVGDDEANRHPSVTRPRREGYELPSV